MDIQKNEGLRTWLEQKGHALIFYMLFQQKDNVV